MPATAIRAAGRRFLLPIVLLTGLIVVGSWWIGRGVESVDTPVASDHRTEAIATTPENAAVGRAVVPRQPGRASEGIASLAVSPDGRRVAGAGRDGSVHVWDMEGAEIEVITAHHGLPTTAVEFTPDGDALVSAGMDSEVHVWNANAEFTALRTLRAHEHAVSALSVSPAGDLIASAGQETRIMLWDAATGALRNILNGHRDFVTAIAFNSDGSRLASASADKNVVVWDVASGELIATLVGHAARVNQVQFMPDDRSVVSAADDGKVIVWDVSSGAPLREIVGRQGPVTSLAVSADGSLLATTGNYNDILLWDPYSGVQVRTIQAGAPIDAIRFAGDGNLVVASAAARVGVWDAISGDRVAQWAVN